MNIEKFNGIIGDISTNSVLLPIVLGAITFKKLIRPMWLLMLLLVIGFIVDYISGIITIGNQINNVYALIESLAVIELLNGYGTYYF